MATAIIPDIKAIVADLEEGDIVRLRELSQELDMLSLEDLTLLLKEFENQKTFVVTVIRTVMDRKRSRAKKGSRRRVFRKSGGSNRPKKNLPKRPRPLSP